MTPEQEAHLQAIKDKIVARIDKKYRRGQADHGGNLWARPAFPDMADEVTDFNTYFVTLEEQLQTMHLLLCEVRICLTVGETAKALDLLDELDAGFRLQLRQSNP